MSEFIYRNYLKSMNLPPELFQKQCNLFTKIFDKKVINFKSQYKTCIKISLFGDRF